HTAAPLPPAGLPRPTPTSAPQERRRRHVVEFLSLAALVLVPWTVHLGLTLPSSYHVHAWRVAWVGFDVLLLAALALTAFLAHRRRPPVIPAVAAAVMLVCDAWFDVSLALGAPGFWAALASAVFVELPLAGYLLHRATLACRRPGNSGPSPPTATASPAPEPPGV
uniref:hypothetical protein n=1 Tax=Kitasatospora sp. MBT63 TaxID=1444768 RepID=UPI0019D6DE53